MVVVRADPASPAKLRVLGRIALLARTNPKPLIEQDCDRTSATEEAAMPSELLPTRRRVLLAGALAATGFALDEAMAEQLPPTPQCHDGDEPTARQTEGPYFAEFPAACRSRRSGSQGGWSSSGAGAHPLLPAGRTGAGRSGTPTSAGNTTMPASVIAGTCSPTPMAATASAPSCWRSIPAAPPLPRKCRRRSGAHHPALLSQ